MPKVIHDYIQWPCRSGDPLTIYYIYLVDSWFAYFDPEGTQGSGRTIQQAIEELLELLNDQES